MIGKILTRMNVFVLTFILPVIYGCGSGGSGDSASNFLFGDGGSTGSSASIDLLSASVGGAPASTGTEVASLINPEPTSLLLLGGGLMAMSYFKSKTSRRK